MDLQDREGTLLDGAWTCAFSLRKRWTLSGRQMLEAGWYYCPTDSSDDFVACPYCNLAVDGWEPKDKPL